MRKKERTICVHATIRRPPFDTRTLGLPTLRARRAQVRQISREKLRRDGPRTREKEKKESPVRRRVDVDDDDDKFATLERLKLGDDAHPSSLRSNTRPPNNVAPGGLAALVRGGLTRRRKCNEKACSCVFRTRSKNNAAGLYSRGTVSEKTRILRILRLLLFVGEKIK